MSATSFRRILIFGLIPGLFVFCDEKNHHTANEYMHSSKFEELTERFENPGRAEWQKPDAVLKLLGDLSGKTVADIGAGTGYFSVRLLQAGARVISLDVDDRFLEYQRDRKKREAAGAGDPAGAGDTWEIRKTGTDRPKLAPGEVDLILLVNVYHHIENRTDYFRAAREGLKQGGRLAVVDFRKEGDHPIGPPAKHRVALDQVRRELSAAGFGSFRTDETTLPYQYVLIAGN